MNHNDPFLTIDREHELQREADEDFDKHLAEVTKRHAAAMLTNARSGHQQTLEDLVMGVCHLMTEETFTETLIHKALISDLAAGQMFRKLVERCIEEDAETAARVEIGRAERAGGLDFAAMRAAAPQEVRVPS